jgi:hypothetical protein
MPLWHAFVVFCIVFCGSVGVTLLIYLHINIEQTIVLSWLIKKVRFH